MKYKIDDRFQKISDNDSKYTIIDILRSATTSNGWYILRKDGYPDTEDFIVWTENEIDEMLEPIPEEPTRWRANKGERYYFIETDGSVHFIYELGLEYDDAKYGIGNYFKTKEEAEKAASWFKAFTTLRDDTKGFEPDWKNEKQKKWGVFYSRFDGEVYIEWYIDCQFSTIIFATEEDAKASIEKHEKEWLIYFGVEE